LAPTWHVAQPCLLVSALGHTPLFAFLILTRSVLQPTFAERSALLCIFRGGLSEPIPADDRVDLRLFLAIDGAVRGQPDVRHSFSGLRVRSSASRVALPIRMTWLTPRILRS
jgi:hypothetical protein